MELEHLNILESKIQQAADLIKFLREENSTLKQKIAQLEQQAGEQAQRITELQQKLVSANAEGVEAQAVLQRENELRRRIEQIIAKLDLLEMQDVHPES